MISYVYKATFVCFLLLLPGCSPTNEGTDFHVRNIFIEGSSVQGFLDLASISNSPFSRKIIESFPDRRNRVFADLTGPAKDFVEEAGIQPEDFAQVAIMMDDLGSLDFKSETLLSGARFALACKVDREVPLELITRHLILGVQDEEETAVKSLLESKQNLNGADIFSLNIENFDGSTLLAHLVLGGATYLIIGDEMTVKEALGSVKPPLSTPGSDIRENLSSDASSWAAAEVSDRVMQALLSVKTGNPFIDGPVQTLKQLRAIGISGNVEETFQIEVQMVFDQADAASQISATVNGLIGMLRLSAMNSKKEMPPFLNTLSIEQKAETLSLNLEFSFEDVIYTENANPQSLANP